MCIEASGPPVVLGRDLSHLRNKSVAQVHRKHGSLLFGIDGEETAYKVEDPGSIPGLGRFLEKGMATHSSILAWRIP